MRLGWFGWARVLGLVAWLCRHGWACAVVSVWLGLCGWVGVSVYLSVCLGLGLGSGLGFGLDSDLDSGSDFGLRVGVGLKLRLRLGGYSWA